ncbi:hypothetical protein [Streptomyces sp. WAC06614]|uniref:hypothetical protein n=1 Tax=Streptomyces sp. WAC06614 TaxID=2487416 RepID=UPI000F76B675|nr:hypothetical protein [Streptomyces sp. WAC06614]RSS60693.1 hypothetical protein EF918_32650 [Streptomyces sp. WAC06614]
MSGLGAGELAARWWKWALSAPAGRSPVVDRTGEHAHWRQPSDVWFLAGTYGGRVERRCTVPTDRPLFFPVLNTQRVAWGWRPEPLRLRVSLARAELNGIPLMLHQATSRRFLAAGLPRVAWGLWGTLDPLVPGEYVLSIQGSAGDFCVDTTYHLRAAEPEAGRA